MNKEIKALECLANIAKCIAVFKLREEGKDECNYMKEMKNVCSAYEFKTIKQDLIKAQEQEKFFDDKLVFKNGCIISGFDYKGKQIVAMPLEEYDEFMKQEKVIRLIFEKKVNILLLELAENVDEYNERIVPNGQLTEEEFNLLKEVKE